MCEVGGGSAVVGHERRNGIRGQADPTWHPQERITSVLRIRPSPAALGGWRRADDRWESEESGAKAQNCRILALRWTP